MGVRHLTILTLCWGDMEEKKHNVVDLALARLIFFFQAEDGIRDGPRDWSSDVCSSDLIVFLIFTMAIAIISGMRKTIAYNLMRTIIVDSERESPQFTKNRNNPDHPSLSEERTARE